MEQFYKDLRIEVSLTLDSDGWFINLFIYYHEEATNVLVTFALDDKFTPYDEAVEAGFAATQKWIEGASRPFRTLWPRLAGTPTKCGGGGWCGYISLTCRGSLKVNVTSFLDRLTTMLKQHSLRWREIALRR